jgi:hypothetical protein
MFLKLLILSIGFILFAVIALGVRLLIIKGSRFPETHISRNKEMRKRGITCAQSIDVGCNPSDNFSSCSSCKVVKH